MRKTNEHHRYRLPGPTDLTWEETHPASYLYRPIGSKPTTATKGTMTEQIPFNDQNIFEPHYRFTLDENGGGFKLTHRYRSRSAAEFNQDAAGSALSCPDGQCLFGYKLADLQDVYTFTCRRLSQAVHNHPCPNLTETLEKSSRLHAYELRQGILIVNPHRAYVPKLQAIIDACDQVRLIQKANDPDKLIWHRDIDGLLIRVKDKQFIPHYQDVIKQYTDIVKKIVEK